MAMYRVYRVDGLGKITAAEWIEADTEEEALSIARELCHSVACEVWHRDRLIGKVRANPDPD